jgi:ABC-2 type transport system ATP-binding protein
MSEYALEVKGLTKLYGDIRAVNNISFAIKRGTIFCFVGPNGAGKTTTMEIVEGLKRPDSGEIELLGMPMPKEQARAKERVGVQLQTTSLFERLKVGEVVDLFRSFYQNPADSENVIAAVSLESKKDEPVTALSGGQQQRLAIALALVNNPELVFLDEPTAGLDPQARRDVWRLIQSLKDEGKTVFLTTHYMDEAEKLSDEVAIIDHGKIIAHDSPRNLIVGLSKANVIEFTTDSAPAEEDFSSLATVGEVNIVGTSVVLYTADIKQCMSELLNLSQQKDFELRDMQFRNPSLEDVFIELTGRMLRD